MATPMAEITRHRLASFCIESQRYVCMDGEIAFVTDAIREGDFESKLGRLGADVKSVIRITDY